MKKNLFAWTALGIWLGLSACAGKDADLPPSYRVLSVPKGLLASKEARHSGRVSFVEHCAICHGMRGDGRGLREIGIAPPDFANDAWQAASTTRHLFFTIREGSAGTAMPSWKSLDERQIWELVAYIRSL